jgi:uncharacterized protein YprB with RNaseH-like and TPR domain
MLDDSLRRRLEALNRAPLPGAGGKRLEGATNGGMKEWRNEGKSQTGDARDRFPPFLQSSIPSSADPTTWLEIGEVVENSAGQHLRIVQAVEALWNGGERLVTARHSILKQASPNENAGELQSPERRGESDGYRTEIRALVESFPDRAMYLDLETCGLAGAALFLVGLLRRIDGRLAVELLLARNYAEEKAVLVSLWERAATHDVLVTFNGKSFDWPMVLDRSTRHLLGKAGIAREKRVDWHEDGGMKEWRNEGKNQAGEAPVGIPSSRDSIRAGPARPELIHVDILHHARRRWRGKLPDCKLQTLERYVCGRRRSGDIPGVEIPAAYQRFVEKGDPREMELILFHNALDLVTLLDLSLRLAGG